MLSPQEGGAIVSGPRFIPAVLLVLSACGTSNRVPAASAAKPADSPEARADALLLAAAKVALPPPGITPGDLADPSSPGAQLVVQFCQQCHALPSPAMHSATDWPRVLRRMWLRMDRLPDSLGIRTADEGERGTVLNYLSANALQVSGAELPAGKGREDFAVVCSRCHALPDIKIHSSGDWPSVFLRMERNMERMNVSRPNEQQTGNILLYLQEVTRNR
jgi:cytochrome c5